MRCKNEEGKKKNPDSENNILVRLMPKTEFYIYEV